MSIQLLVSVLSRAFSKPFVHVACIILSGFLSYANTFNVPFVFDDNRSIVENFFIKNLDSLWPPSGVRWFGHLTFALNYAVGGIEVAGYHYVNLIIHISASLLIYRLMVLTFQTPFCTAIEQPYLHKQTKRFIALVVALLFVSHPLQTQAVTYIVQRFASLATMLFIASVVCYVQARISLIRKDIRKCYRILYSLIWYVIALLFAVLAMKTKEIAFTLPFIIIIYEFAFFPRRPVFERFSLLIPIGLTLFVIPFNLFCVGSGVASAVTQATTNISRHDYLLTQFRVLVTYLRLLIFPINQMIDYNQPILKNIFDPNVYVSFILLLTLFLFSIVLLLKGGCGKIPHELRIVGFGGLWFFITASIESSIIPITDLIFEHRIYLPSVGFFVAITVIGSFLIKQLSARFQKSTIYITSIIVCTLVALPVATHLRNKVWQSEIALWEDVVQKNPDNSRAHAIIGTKLIESGQTDLAIKYFQEALRLKPDYADANICLGNAYLKKGMLEDAYSQYLKALLLGSLDFESTAQLLMNIGNYNLKKNLPDLAIYYYQQAFSITPNNADIHYNLGIAYKIKGMTTQSTDAFTKAHQLYPERY